MCRSLPFVLSLLALVMNCVGQDSRGAISGRVTDSSGAILPSAQVRATNIQTGVSVEARSNESGLYTLPYLLPGVYDITVELGGFKKLERRKIEVRVNDNVSLDLMLTVGDVTESVQVTAATPLLETSNVSLGQVVDQRRMTELPIASGNAAELVLLAPGTSNGTDLRSRKAAFNAAPSQVTTDGNALYSNEFAIDGVPNTFATGTVPRVAFSPPQSAISEFKVQTASYDAAIGHTPGSVINLTTSSGTNGFHGEAHEFFSNSALDAPNFFQNRSGQKKLGYQDNRYGASIGGPVVLPKLYNGRNKTFFFYTYEGNKWGVPQTSVATVPTAKELNGDFSDLLKLGPQYQIYDPMSTRACRPAGNPEGKPADNCPVGVNLIRDPFPGNIIPADRINPIARAMAGYWPTPNAPGTREGRNNYTNSSKALEDYYVHFARVDHNFSENHRMFARLDYDWWNEDKSDLYGNLTTGVNLNRINRGLALDDVYVLNPTTIINVRYGITQQEFPERRRSQGFDLASLGFSPSLLGLTSADLATFPNAAFGTSVGNTSAYSGFGGWETGDGTNTGMIHNINGSLTSLFGSHSLHYGVDFRLYRAFANRYPYDISPSFGFTPAYARGPYITSAAAPIGQELAEFLLGIPEGRMQRTASYATQETFYGFFLQDDWKVTKKLTLNLGIRLEHESPITERYNRAVKGFDYTAVNPIQAQAAANYAKNPIPELPVGNFRTLGGLQFAGGENGRELWSGQPFTILPRIGIAYQLNSKTVIRSGYGIFYDTIGTNRSPAIQTGFTATTPIIASSDNGQSYIATLGNPFPNGLQSTAGGGGGLTTNLGQDIEVYPLRRVQPYAQRWSFGFQRELPLGFLLDTSYVGNHAIRLPIKRDLNYTDPTYLSRSSERDNAAITYLGQQFANPFYGLNSVYTQNISRAGLLKPYPQFGKVEQTDPVGYSWYHSLQAQVVKRFSQGYTLNVAYTFSKTMSAEQPTPTTQAFLNPSDPTPWYGISSMDFPHRLVVSGIWEVPIGRGRHYASDVPKWMDSFIGGWQIGALVARQAGAPLNWGNVIFRGDIKDIPLDKGERTVDQWFNTDAGFEKAAGKQLDTATSIRTFPLRLSGVRTDGQAKWDFSALKNFTLTERLNLQVRADCYNCLNHANLTAPNMAVNASTFGAITAQNGMPRQFQLAAKIRF